MAGANWHQRDGRAIAFKKDGFGAGKWPIRFKPDGHERPLPAYLGGSPELLRLLVDRTILFVHSYKSGRAADEQRDTAFWKMSVLRRRANPVAIDSIMAP